MDYGLIGGVLGGIAAGGLIVWLATHGRFLLLQHKLDHLNGEADALKRQMTEREEQSSQMGDKIVDLTGQLHGAETTAARVPNLEEEMTRLRLECNQKADVVARLETAIEKERKAAEEKQALLDEARAKLSDAFTKLAFEALTANNQSFLELAKQNLLTEREASKGELEKRQQAIEELVKPLREQLDTYQNQIKQMENLREGAYSALKTQIETMQGTQKNLERETGNLVKALRNPTVRGRWGEITLRRVVELAGMVDRCDFKEQVTIAAEEGRLRPDMIIYLPEDRIVVVDSKTPLDAYLKMIEAADDETRSSALRLHADQIQTHLDTLSQKEYWSQFTTTPEFVILFIPAEGILSAALEVRPTLMEDGFKKKVILASPSTLMTLLRTVAMGWRQEQQAKNAQRISKLGSELYERLATVVSYLEDLGSSLESSVKHYNSAVRSFESRLLGTARKFPPLGVQSSDKKRLPDEMRQIEILPVQPAQPSLGLVLEEPDPEPETLENSDPR